MTEVTSVPSTNRGRLGQLLLAGLLIAGCWLVGPGVRWASAQTEGDSTGSAEADQPQNGAEGSTVRRELSDRRIQVLRTDQSRGRVEVDVAIPPAIAEAVPTQSDFGLLVGQRPVGDFEVVVMSTAVDVMVVIDTSGSMSKGDAIGRAKAAARSFVDRLPADTAVGVIGFGETATVVAPPGLDRAITTDAIDQLSADGKTALWDALSLAAQTLGSGSGRSASGDSAAYAVLLSDGGDTVSSQSKADAVRQLTDAGVGLYAIAIETAESDHDALSATVAAVGGNLALTTDTAQLDPLYAEVAERLAARYRLRFSDPMGADGSNQDRKVLISVKDGDSLAMARAVLPAAGDRSGVGAGQADGAGADPAGPAQVLNSDQSTLGTVAPATPSVLGRAIMLPIGAGAVFLALLVAGIVLFSPSISVSLTSANTADRVSGFNERFSGAVDRIIDRRDSEGELDRALDAAGISLRPGEFTLVALAVIIVPSMLVWLLSGTVGAVVTTLLAAAALYIFVSSRADRRRQKFAAQLTDTLGIMTGSLRAGRGLPQAIDLVASEAPDPTAEQFRRVQFETRVGRDITESMMGVAKRMKSQDFEWVTKAVDINRELGGDLTEVLDNVANTIRDRHRIARMVRSLSAEGRASGWVLLSLPPLMFLFVLWRTPENAILMIETGIGRVMSLIAVAGMVIGYLWIRKLVDLKY